MILSIHIEDFAIIDDLWLHLGPGLNVLTGETGTGKSIVIDAVEVALGGRALSEYVRHGADRALVELVFGDLGPDTLKYLEEMGLSSEEELVISREILASGRSLARLNGRSATAQMLKSVAALLIDLHGQHEHQSLLNPTRHLELLDAFGGSSVCRQRDVVAHAFREVSRLRSLLASLGMNERERAQRLDILEYQLNEISGAGLGENEEEEILSRRRVLASAERLRQLGSEAYTLIHEGRGPSSQEMAGKALSLLEDASRLDPSLSGTADDVRQAALLLQDAASSLSRYLEEIQLDPGELSLIEDRLDLIVRLKRKYGGSIKQVLEFADAAEKEIERLRGSEEEAAVLEDKLAKSEGSLVRAAQALSDLRKEAAGELERRVAGELEDLAMSKAELVVSFTRKQAPDAHGVDDIEFMLSANPGEPPRPLHKTASGGEMSRIMLALKASLAEVDDIPTLIFDEIDAGIGGRTANVLGWKLQGLSRNRQVICVTHLAAIASQAKTHFSVKKTTDAGRTVTTVDTLEGSLRLEEIARMLGGEVTETTLKHAQEMISRSDLD